MILQTLTQIDYIIFSYKLIAMSTIECRLTIYEAAKLLGTRAKDISYGKPTTVKVLDKNLTATDIAILEKEAKKLPLKLIREYPNGEKKILNPNSMIWPN